MKLKRSPLERRLLREYRRHLQSEQQLYARWLLRWRENAPHDELVAIECRMAAARGAMDAIRPLLDDLQLGKLEAA